LIWIITLALTRRGADVAFVADYNQGAAVGAVVPVDIRAVAVMADLIFPVISE